MWALDPDDDVCFFENEMKFAFLNANSRKKITLKLSLVCQ